MYNRKWYVVQKAKDEEIPNDIKIKRTKDATIVKFICDETYSAIQNTRIQPFGTTEMDQKRGKRDEKDYKLVTIAKRNTDKDQNNLQNEEGKQENEDNSPPDTKNYKCNNE